MIYMQLLKRFKRNNRVQKASNLLKANKPLVLFIIYLSVLIDGLFIETNSDFITFTILGLYIFFASYFKQAARNTFIFSLVLLVVMYVSFLLSGPSISTEKIAVWLVLFLLVGIIRQWRET